MYVIKIHEIKTRNLKKNGRGIVGEFGGRKGEKEYVMLNFLHAI